MITIARYMLLHGKPEERWVVHHFIVLYTLHAVTTNVQTLYHGINSVLITHAGIAAGVGRAFSHVCLFVCSHSYRKTT